MKKLLICMAELAGCSSYASASGLYLGGGLGWSDTQYTDSFKEEGREDAGMDLNGAGPVISLFGGYRQDLGSRFFAALEANVQASKASFENTDFGDEFTIDQQSSFGIGALAGTQLGFGSLYGRIGYQLAGYDIVEKQDGFPEDDFKTETSHSGLRFGIGSEFNLDNRTKLRMDWSRTLYSEEQFRKVDDEDEGLSFTEHLEPSETIFLVGLVRTF